MRRDGKNVSIWQDTAELPPMRQSIPSEAEVVIVGGGITGLTAALRLQAAGKSCLVLEAQRIGFGTTGGTSAHLNTILDTPYTEIMQLHGEARTRQVVASTRDAISIIRDHIERYDISCGFSDCGGMMYAENVDELKALVEIADVLRKMDIPVFSLPEKAMPLRALGAIRFEGQARFHPIQYIEGLLQAYLELGGRVVEKALVQQVDEKDTHLEVHVDGGQFFRTEHLIYATHTPPGIQLMNFRVAPYRSYLQVWELENELDCPDDMWYDMKDPFHYFRNVALGGKNYVMVGGQDHKTAHEEDQQSNFRELEAFVRGMFRVAEKKYQWSSQYYESPDRLPFIGYYPDKQSNSTLLATGFSGNGMIFGSLGGAMMADLILKGVCDYQQLYSPARIGPLASFKDLVKENIDVAAHFVKDRFAYEKIESLSELSKGEGKLLIYEGKKLALYRGEDGNLLALDPVCRHAGCTVKWNNAEHTWDCPCHGARYSAEGKVLTGPSVVHLPAISLVRDER